MTPEHETMITALAAATATVREPTAGCPDGISRWHTPARLLDEGHLAGVTVTDIHRTGAALQRRGLAVHRTQFGETRWALTETGAGLARHLSKRTIPAPATAPRGRADRKVLARSAS
jgi:hypothetical protein